MLYKLVYVKHMLYTCTTLSYTVMKKNTIQPALSPKNTDKVITLLSNFFDQFSSKESEQGLHQVTQSHIAFGYEHNHDKANTAHLTHEISQLLTALEKINNKVNKEAAVC